jgi:aminoglycoside 6-adenylyltransferase
MKRFDPSLFLVSAGRMCIITSMADKELTYEDIIKRFFTWAKAQADIRCCLIIGSRARTDHPADEWADLDIVIFAENPTAYIATGSWAEKFGTVVLSFVEPTVDGNSQERRVMYEGGLDVDYAFFPLEMISRILNNEVSEHIYRTLGRGVKVLFDKDGMIEEFLKHGLKQFYDQLPAPEEYFNCVNDFWYHAVWTAKHLRRGEVFWAKGSCDSHLKDLLRRMLEWHVRATKSRKRDTWLRGRFLEEWADKRAIKELGEAFARYEISDIWRALINTMDLFRWVAKETAVGLKCEYPIDADRYATALVLQLELDR